MASGPDDKSFEALTGDFLAWGVSDPETWARSQAEEGIDQYGRLVFLRGAWQAVLKDGDTSWMDPLIARSEARPTEPGAGAGQALKRLLTAGASRSDLAELVRVMQWETMAGLAYQLSDPGVVTYPSSDVPRVEWALVRIDADGQPISEIGSLHESVLETDPTGREMRPASPTAGR